MLLQDDRVPGQDPRCVEGRQPVVAAVDEHEVAALRVHRQPRLDGIPAVVPLDEVVDLVEAPARGDRLPRGRDLVRADGEASGAARLTALELSISRKVGENDQLYGSVTNADIGDLLKEKGFEVDRRKILLPDPIKTLGETTVPVKLHRDVTAQLRVQVVKEE